MSILTRTSLHLTRILLRCSLNRYTTKQLYPFRRDREDFARKLMLVSFYCTKGNKSVADASTIIADIKPELTSAGPLNIDKNSTDESISEIEEKNEEIETKEGEETASKLSVDTSVSPTIISRVTQTSSARTTSSTGDEDGDHKDDANSWRTMKYTFTIFGVTVTVTGLFLLMEFGAPGLGEDGQVIEDEYSKLSIPAQYIYRTFKQMNYYRKLINEPSRDKLLPDELKYPYHQPPYTLVLEFKDVLVHPDWTYNTGWRFKKRPGIDQFLEMLSGIYEIVIYTAELGMTVFPILEVLDPNNLITYKLVRDATNFTDGHHVKDLGKLNRNLNKVILVDWDTDSVLDHQDNVLKVLRWDGNDFDTTLLDLANFLRVIAMSDVQDVRDVLRYYSQFDDPIAAFREKQRELERTMYNRK
ncbi:nuclear lim interactor-interacting factor-related [Holotrichia oblita]|uniref:Nuclear lim interactor-interacting factor-related n=1 Tax=Holotrichia oblita TaxID=644536 RepID=A0ACB9SHV8_HOLOL|nr:nuclear lim interactor-interacting factor-related [Holotrichia oblita]